MPSLVLQPSVLLHAHKRMRAHTLVLYILSAEEEGLVHWHTVRLPSESWEVDSLPPVVHQKGPVFIRWYASVYREEDGMWAQEMIGAGCNHRSSHSAKLEDILLNEVGTVKVEGMELPPYNEDHHPLNEEAQQLIRDVEKAMSALPTRCRVENDSFPDVAIHLDRVTALPSIWFALDSTRMKFDVVNAVKYFENSLRCVIRQSAQGRPAPPEQTLADLIALPSLGWIYRSDSTQSEEACDAWSSLWTYPGPDPPAFDCEDGAKALMELFLVFQRLPTFRNNPELRALQSLARTYVPWFAIGELFSQDGGSAKSRSGVGLSGDYLMHCYVVLLPTGKGAKSITLESTAYASGVWDAERESKREKAAHRREQEWVDALPSAQDRENARVRCPMSMVAEQKMYGKLVALYSCSVPEGRAQFKLMGGVDTTTFLLDPSSHDPVSVPIDLPLEEVKRIFHRELQLSPPPSFPLAPLLLDHVSDAKGVLFPLQDATGADVAVTRTTFLASRS